MSQGNESVKQEQSGNGAKEGSSRAPTPFPASPTAVSQADGEA